MEQGAALLAYWRERIAAGDKVLCGSGAGTIRITDISDDGLITGALVGAAAETIMCDVRQVDE
jgi:hypothetical protein